MARHRHRRRFRHYRAAFLALLGAASIAYGAAIIVVVASDRIPWLPDTGLIAGLPRFTWGVTWAGSGVLEAGLCWLRPARRFLFGIGAAIVAGWACAFMTHWLRHGDPGGWAPAVTSALVAALILLASAWPDPP